MSIGDPYVTTAELADYLKISGNTNDTQLSDAVNAASRWVERYCHRQFNLADAPSPRTFTAKLSRVLYVDDIGDDTILVASDNGEDGSFGTAWTADDFRVDPQTGVSDGEAITALHAASSLDFPQSCDRTGLVRVTATWGWPEVPSDVRLAALIQAARLYKRRESPEGVLGASDFGIVRVGSRIDPDVAALLEDYRLIVWAF